MKEDSLFKEDAVFLLDNRADDTATDILKMIGNKMTELGYAKESFKEALLEREAKYPTGLRIEPYSVAIPHTDPGHIYNPCICVVKLKEGVEFHEMVNTQALVRVNFIFCIALPEGEKQTNVLQHVMGIAGNREMMEALNKAENPEEIYRIVCEC